MNDQQVYALPEAAEAVGLSVKTLRKRAQDEAKQAAEQGRPAQAFMQEFRGGQRWVVTSTLLATLQEGAQQGSPTGSPVGTQKNTQHIADLEQQIKDLQAQLQFANLRADSHEAIANERAARLYELQQSVGALSGAVKALTEAKQDKRRWWSRKTKELGNPATP